MIKKYVDSLGKPFVYFTKHKLNLGLSFDEVDAEEDDEDFNLEYPEYVSTNGTMTVSCDEHSNIRFIILKNEIMDLAQIGLPNSRRAVQEFLGYPSKSSRAGMQSGFGPWDRFDFTDYSLHIEYTQTDSIKQITIIRPDSVPS